MLKVDLHWQGSTSLFGAERLTLKLSSGTTQQFGVERLQAAGKYLLVKLQGVDDRDAALALRGAVVLVERAELPQLGADEAYLVDLVGVQVFAPDGLVGEVVDISVNPSVDSLQIRCPDGRLVEQPLLPGFVVAIDVAAKRVELASRDGLIE